jgi:type I restriction enzyme S subunit
MENKRLPEALTPRVHLELKEGDLLITRAGPRARAGVCCLVGKIRPRLMICDKVYRFRVNETRVLARFLVLALNTPSMIEHIDTLKTGISDSGVNLTQEKFSTLTVPLPPILEQREIVRRVDELFILADQVEARYLKAKQYVDSLKQSILAKAFRGELVPQDPNDEPATVLLERIRQARTTQQRDRSGRRVNKSDPERRKSGWPYARSIGGSQDESST